jgi:hypothetical protein
MLHSRKFEENYEQYCITIIDLWGFVLIEKNKYETLTSTGTLFSLDKTEKHMVRGNPFLRRTGLRQFTAFL